MAEKKPKKKVGRPILPKDQVRGNITTLRLQPEERASFERAAKKKGQTLSDWIRQTLKSILDRDI